MFSKRAEKFFKKNKIKTLFVKTLKAQLVESAVFSFAKRNKDETPSHVISLVLESLDLSVSDFIYWTRMHLRALRWEKEEKI